MAELIQVAGNGLRIDVLFSAAAPSSPAMRSPRRRGPLRSPKKPGAGPRARSRPRTKSPRASRTRWRARSRNPRARRAPRTRALRITCSTVRSRRTDCTSRSTTRARRTSTRREHRLVIHGLVKRPLAFSARCARAATRWSRAWRSSSAAATARRSSRNAADPGDGAGAARTGVLRGVDRRAAVDACSRRPASIRRRSGSSPKAPTRWPSAAACRSSKALDDAMVALYQNGERLMPGNGYPMRPAACPAGKAT